MHRCKKILELTACIASPTGQSSIQFYNDSCQHASAGALQRDKHCEGQHMMPREEQHGTMQQVAILAHQVATDPGTDKTEGQHSKLEEFRTAVGC